jgi:hypothetical protein
MEEVVLSQNLQAVAAGKEPVPTCDWDLRVWHYNIQWWTRH